MVTVVVTVGAKYFGTWTSIYTGNATFYEDRGLTIYTTYRYRVSVYNNYGHMTSDSSPEVATFGGMPKVAPTVTVKALVHISIHVAWVTPCE